MSFKSYDILSFDRITGEMIFIYNDDKNKTISINILQNYPDYRGVNKDVHYVSLTTKDVVVIPDAKSRMKSYRIPTYGCISDPETGELFRPATQIDYDLFEFKNTKTPDGDLTDNGKIYSYLLDEYQSAYLSYR